MGEGFGVKQADPDMKFVFGGLAGLSLSYIQAMKLWSDYYRNGSFPADVINVHHYCNTRGRQHPKEIAYGISPEEDGLKEKLEKLVKWRNANLPDKEICSPKSVGIPIRTPTSPRQKGISAIPMVSR